MNVAKTVPRLMWGRLFHSIRDRLAEWGSAAIMAGCGYILAFGPPLETGSLSNLLNTAPQASWAKMFLLVAVTRLLILAINGALLRSPHYRAACSLVSLVIWLQMVMANAATAPWTFSTVASIGLMVMDFAAMGRAAMEAAYSDKRRAADHDA